MFCDGCGTAVQPGQAFCSRCGKQIIGPVAAIARRAGRVASHLPLVAILWLAFSAFNAIAGLLALLAFNLFAHRLNVPPFVFALLGSIGWFVLLKAAVGMAAGFGLLQREPWARTLVLILAFISLFNFPFGTVLGVYTLWVLLPRESDQEYEAIVSSRAA